MTEQRSLLPSSQRLTVTVGLFLLTALGISFGWLMVFSASYPIADALKKDPFFFANRQLLFIVSGLVLFFVACFFPMGKLRRWGWVIHLIVLVFLALTLWIGKPIDGVQRWLVFGKFQVQPSEFAKVSLVLALASLLTHCHSLPRWQQRLGMFSLCIALWFLTVGLVVCQPHLSGALILFLIGLSTLFFTGISIPLLLTILLLVGVLGDINKNRVLHEYQNERIKLGHGFVKPIERLHPQSKQAIRALGSGGLFGRGLFQSRQKHLFLPSAHNDFIFAVIGEEWGWLATMGVLFSFSLFAYFGLMVAARAPDAFVAGVAGGLTSAIWLQAMLHIVVNIGWLPPTGVPLPLISAGGSSMWSTLLAMGLLINSAGQMTRKPSKSRSVTNHEVGDGRRRDRRSHLPSPNYRCNSKNEIA